MDCSYQSWFEHWKLWTTTCHQSFHILINGDFFPIYVFSNQRTTKKRRCCFGGSGSLWTCVTKVPLVVIWTWRRVALWISTGPFLSEGFWREGRPRFFLLQYRPGELVPCDFVWLVKVSLEVLLQNTYKSRSKTAKKGSERSLFPSLTSGSSASISNLIFYVTPTLSILAICDGHL